LEIEEKQATSASMVPGSTSGSTTSKWGDASVGQQRQALAAKVTTSRHPDRSGITQAPDASAQPENITVERSEHRETVVADVDKAVQARFPDLAHFEAAETASDHWDVATGRLDVSEVWWMDQPVVSIWRSR
jgi:hypothetical protein